MWGTWQALGWIPDLNKPARILAGIDIDSGPSRVVLFLSVTTPSEDVLVALACQWLSLSPHSEDLSQKESSIRTELRKRTSSQEGQKRAHDIHGLVLGHTYPLESLGFFEQNWSFLSVYLFCFQFTELISGWLANKGVCFPESSYIAAGLSLFYFWATIITNSEEVLFGHPIETSLLLHFLYK